MKFFNTKWKTKEQQYEYFERTDNWVNILLIDLITTVFSNCFLANTSHSNSIWVWIFDKSIEKYPDDHELHLVIYYLYVYYFWFIPPFSDCIHFACCRKVNFLFCSKCVSICHQPHIILLFSLILLTISIFNHYQTTK